MYMPLILGTIYFAVKHVPELPRDESPFCVIDYYYHGSVCYVNAQQGPP